MNKIKQDSYELILKQTGSKKAGAFSFKKTYPAYIILLVFLVVSFFIRYFADKSINDGLNNEFNKTTTSIMSRVSSHFSKQTEVLNSMNGLYDLLIEVSKDYFELYATVPTTNYPSLMSVFYLPKVYKDSVFNFVVTARNLGYYDYELKSKSPKEIYYPIVNIVPYANNSHRLGIDMGENELTLDAINKARDNNFMTASDAYIIRPPDTMGFFVFYPVYFKESERGTIEQRQDNFQAVLSLEINFPKFIQEALSGTQKNKSIAAPADTTVMYEVFGKNNTGTDYPIYKSPNYNLSGSYEPLITNIVPLKIADKEFYVKFLSVPNYGGKFQQILPNLAFLVSLIISIALFGFILTQMTNRARAQEIADKMTRSQRRIVDTSNDIIAVLDTDLIWKSMNPASLAIYGILPEDMIGKSFDTNLLDKNVVQKLKDSYSTGNDDHVERIDLQMIKQNDDLVWVDWSFTFSKTDGLIYCIGRDVTLEKQAEANARLKSKQIEAAEVLSREANFSKSYFMKEMSHQLRNSLTGILGYLQLLQTKVYDGEEELDLYVDMAATSSEELFTYVTDIDEAAKLNEIDTNSMSLQNIDLNLVFNEAMLSIATDNDGKFKPSDFTISEEIKTAHILGDYNYAKDVIIDTISLLAVGEDKVTFDVNAEINPYEGAVELQVLSSGNKTVHDLIEIYKKNFENIIESLQYDSDDALLKMMKIASTMRLLRGSFKIDTFGIKDGNLISIIFKAPKKAS